MARTTAHGLHVWDLSTDPYDHTQLAANWDTIDGFLGSAATSMQTLATVPSTGNFAGRLVMLTASDSGFQPWTLIRYDGSAWRAVGNPEVQPAVPSSGNFAGRIVVLSAASGSFSAWDVIRYDGTQWGTIGGGWGLVSTGGGATNIAGVYNTGDVYINASARGFVLVDRTDGTKRRIFLQSGSLYTELVT